MSINDNIKIYRQRKGLTLEEVGDYIGVSKSTVLKYENGSITNIPSDKIERMAMLFGVTPGEIMGWKKQPTKTIDESDLKVALFGGDGEVTDEMWQEVKNFAQYIKSQRKNDANDN